MTSARQLTPSPKAWLVDDADNLVKRASGEGGSALVTFTFVTEDLNGDLFIGTASEYAEAGSDGTYSFDTVAPRTVFGLEATLEFAIGNEVPRLVVTIGQQETCTAGWEYAQNGLVSCAKCPDNGICDGSSTVKVNPGYWRGSASSVAIYDCPAGEHACYGGMGTACAPGYTGVRCGGCDVGYGRSGLQCSECYEKSVSWAMLSVMAVGFVGLVIYLSIGTMPVACRSDAELYILQHSERNPVSIVVKIALTHLQMVSLIPFSQLSLPPVLSNFMSGSGSLSKVNPNLSFVSCEVAGDAVETLYFVLAVIPCSLIALAAVAAAAAVIATRRAPGAKERATILREGAAIGTATLPEQRRHVAEIVAATAAHFRRLLEAHDELLNDEEQAHIDLVSSADETKPRAELRDRFVNMLAVVFLVLLFFLYPTVVDAATGMLSCETLIGDPSEPPLHTLKRDPSVDCDAKTYQTQRPVAWFALVVVGLGAPLLNYLLVHAVRVTSCGGSMELAKLVFFFSTGGYRDDVWFWESISLLRKMCLVVALAVVYNTSLGILLAIWVLIAAVVLNVIAKPWAEPVLSATEAVSLCACAASYGLCELLLFAPIAENSSAVNAVFVLLGLVNLVALVAFAIALLWSVKRFVAANAKRGGFVGEIFRKVQALVEDRKSRLARVSTDVRHMRRQVRNVHSRSIATQFLKKMSARLLAQVDNAHVRGGRLRASFVQKFLTEDARNATPDAFSPALEWSRSISMKRRRPSETSVQHASVQICERDDSTAVLPNRSHFGISDVSVGGVGARTSKSGACSHSNQDCRVVGVGKGAKYLAKTSSRDFLSDTVEVGCTVITPATLQPWRFELSDSFDVVKGAKYLAMTSPCDFLSDTVAVGFELGYHAPATTQAETTACASTLAHESPHQGLHSYPLQPGIAVEAIGRHIITHVEVTDLTEVVPFPQLYQAIAMQQDYCIVPDEHMPPDGAKAMMATLSHSHEVHPTQSPSLPHYDHRTLLPGQIMEGEEGSELSAPTRVRSEGPSNAELRWVPSVLSNILTPSLHTSAAATQPSVLPHNGRHETSCEATVDSNEADNEAGEIETRMHEAKITRATHHELKRLATDDASYHGAGTSAAALRLPTSHTELIAAAEDVRVRLYELWKYETYCVLRLKGASRAASRATGVVTTSLAATQLREILQELFEMETRAFLALRRLGSLLAQGAEPHRCNDEVSLID